MSEVVVRYLKCRVGHQWYGIDVNQVIEVLHFMLLTELPGASHDLLGMMTLRNQIIPVRDLRLRFGLVDVPIRMDTPIIAVNTQQSAVGLVVDDVDDLAEVTVAQITAHEGEVSPYIAGVARLSDRLLLLLNTERIFSGS